jgi:hypothetical protein
MRRMQLLIAVLGSLILGFVTGCTEYRVNDEYAIDPVHLSPEALAEVPDHRVCEAYAQTRTAKLQAELERRGVFTELEWQAIKARKVVTGMSETALMTALPGITRTRTLRSNGVVTKEWFYAKLSDQFVKVRTENGKVVSFDGS